MADVGQWVLAVILVCLIAVVPIFIVRLVIISVMVPGGFVGAAGSQSALQALRSADIVAVFATIPFTLVAQLLAAGLQRRALLQVHGFTPGIGEIFSLGGMGVHVLAFGVLAAIIAAPFQLYVVYVNDPSNPFAVFAPTAFLGCCGIGAVMFALQILLIFTPLVIMDQRLPVGPPSLRPSQPFCRTSSRFSGF